MSVLIGQGITTLMWNKAMNDVGAAKSAIVLNLQPLMTMFLDFLIYHNTLTWQKMSGAVIVFGGILLSTVQKEFFMKKRIPVKQIGKTNEIVKKEMG
jgi:drug/metabolite transporter (DMT)-like permease